MDVLSDEHLEKIDAEAERVPSVREEVPSETSVDRSIRTLSRLKADKSERRLAQGERPQGDGILFGTGGVEGNWDPSGGLPDSCGEVPSDQPAGDSAMT